MNDKFEAAKDTVVKMSYYQRILLAYTVGTASFGLGFGIQVGTGAGFIATGCAIAVGCLFALLTEATSS